MGTGNELSPSTFKIFWIKKGAHLGTVAGMRHTVVWTWPFSVPSHGHMHMKKLRLEETNPTPRLQYTKVVLALIELPLSSIGHHLKSFKKRDIFLPISLHNAV